MFGKNLEVPSGAWNCDTSLPGFAYSTVHDLLAFRARCLRFMVLFDRAVGLLRELD